MANKDVIAQYLRGLGLNDVGIAAFLGNFQTESGFNPTDYNAREGAIGIAQWENGRRTNLQHYAASHGGKETDLNIQLGYLQSELNGGYHRVITALQGVTDVNKAAQIVQSQFEGSTPDSLPQRQANARAALTQLQGGAMGGTITALPTGLGLGESDTHDVNFGGPFGFNKPPTDIVPPPATNAGAPNLTTKQRQEIIDYLNATHVLLDSGAFNWDDANAKGMGIPNGVALNAMSDMDLRKTWARVWNDLSVGKYGHAKQTTTDTHNLPDVPDVLKPFESVISSLTTAFSFLTTAKNWERIGLFVLGALILFEVSRSLVK